MKRIILTVAILVLTGTSATYGIDAMGSAFGTLSTAATLSQGTTRIGGGLGIADGTSFFGTLTYGLADYFDGKIKIGIFDPDYGDAKIVFGAEAKYQIMSVHDVTPKPVDVSLGGLFEYVSFSGIDVLQIGVLGMVSYPIQLSNGNPLAIYGRANIRIERVDIGILGSESELKIGINGGVAYGITQDINLYGEFQLDGNDGLFLGIDFRVL